MSIEDLYQKALSGFVPVIYNRAIEKIATHYNSKYSNANKISFLSPKTLDKLLDSLAPRLVEYYYHIKLLPSCIVRHHYYIKFLLYFLVQTYYQLNLVL